MNLKPQLVADWRQCHRLWSMRWILVTAFLAAIPVAYSSLPPDWLPTIPEAVKRGLSYAVLLSAGFAGVSRVLAQPGLPPVANPPLSPPKGDAP